jgi:hypothetical protein
MLVVAGWKWPLCPDSTEGIYVLTCMITCIPGTWHHARRRHATMLSREFLSSGRFKGASCDVSSLFVACIDAAVSRASWSLGLYTPVHAPSSLLYTLPGWHSLTRCSQVAPVLCHGRRHVCSGLTLLPAWYKTSTAQGLARCNNEIGREQWATGVSAPEAQDLESLSTGSCHGLALCATTSTISRTANR